MIYVVYMKKKTVFEFTDEERGVLEKLRGLNPGCNKKMIVVMALRHALQNGLSIGFVTKDGDVVAGMPLAGSAGGKKKTDTSEDICRAAGGAVKDGLCHAMKYEVLPTGHVARMPRTYSLLSLPKTADEFIKELYGKFSSKNEAEREYKKKPIS